MNSDKLIYSSELFRREVSGFEFIAHNEENEQNERSDENERIPFND